MKNLNCFIISGVVFLLLIGCKNHSVSNSSKDFQISENKNIQFSQTMNILIDSFLNELKLYKQGGYPVGYMRIIDKGENGNIKLYFTGIDLDWLYDFNQLRKENIDVDVDIDNIIIRDSIYLIIDYNLSAIIKNSASNQYLNSLIDE